MARLISNDDSLSPGAAREYMRDDPDGKVSQLDAQVRCAIRRGLATEPGTRHTLANLLRYLNPKPWSGETILYPWENILYPSNPGIYRYIQHLVREYILDAPTTPPVAISPIATGTAQASGTEDHPMELF